MSISTLPPEETLPQKGIDLLPCLWDRGFPGSGLQVEARPPSVACKAPAPGSCLPVKPSSPLSWSFPGHCPLVVSCQVSLVSMSLAPRILSTVPSLSAHLPKFSSPPPLPPESLSCLPWLTWEGKPRETVLLSASLSEPLLCCPLWGLLSPHPPYLAQHLAHSRCPVKNV